MKILIVMDPFIPVPPIHYGGIERVVYDIACQYTEMGHKVTIVAGPNSKSPGNLIIYGRNGSLVAGINLKLLCEVFLILRKEVKQHDVIHNFGRLLFLIPFMWNNISKIQTYMRYVNIKNIKLVEFMAPKNLKFTSVSEAITKTGKTSNTSWTTIYNCTSVKSFIFEEDTPSTNYLVFLGRIERCKGLHIAIKVAQNTNYQLIIAGNISILDEEKLYYEQEIKPLIDDEKIVFVGPVDNIQKNKLLGNASALLTPVQWFEPFPIIIPEAYACGTPVLGFDNGGIKEGIDHGVTGYLSKSIEEMTEHVKSIHLLSRGACREKAEEEYDDRIIAQNYLSVYNF